MTTLEQMQTIQAAKAILRKNVSNILNNMSTQDCLYQSEKIHQKVISMPAWKKAKRISIYLSMEKEVQTDFLVKTALIEGKDCFVPICKGDDMWMLKLKGMEDFKSLPKNSWGIRQPKPIFGREDAMITGGVDLVIVPGMAFTLEGHRLGHGRGYYDRFLKSLKQLSISENNTPQSIGLAFDQQIFPTLPINEFDVTIDKVHCPLNIDLNADS